MKKQIQDAIEVQMEIITEREISNDAKEEAVSNYLKHIGCKNVEMHNIGSIGMAVGFSVDDMELSDVVKYNEYILNMEQFNNREPKDGCDCDAKCKALPTLQDIRELLQATLELDMEIFTTSVEAGMPIEKLMEDVVAKQKKSEDFLELTKPLIALKKAMSK